MTIRVTTRFGLPFVRRGESPPTPTSQLVDVSEQLAAAVEAQLGAAIDSLTGKLGVRHDWQSNISYTNTVSPNNTGSPKAYLINAGWWQQIGTVVLWGLDIQASDGSALGTGGSAVGRVRIGSPQAFGGAPAPAASASQIGAGTFFSWAVDPGQQFSIGVGVGVGGALAGGIGAMGWTGGAAQLILPPAAKDRAILFGAYPVA